MFEIEIIVEMCRIHSPFLQYIVLFNTDVTFSAGLYWCGTWYGEDLSILLVLTYCGANIYALHV